MPHCSPAGGSLYADFEGALIERKSVSARKNHPRKQTQSGDALRFTADHIVRAIDAVQQAGLTVYGVEITLQGSIKINTTSPFKRAAVPKPETSADTQDEVQPNRKRA